MNVRLAFQGGAELKRALDRAGAELTRTLVIAALKEAADPIRRDMAARMARGERAPHAADNVIVAVVNEIDGEKLAPLEFAVGIGPTKDFWYWFFQEFGTVRHSAQPAMRPAFDAGAQRALKDIGNGLWDAIAKSAQRARSTNGRAA